MDRRPGFIDSSKRPEKWGIDLVIPDLVVQPVFHYTTAAPYMEEKHGCVLIYLRDTDGLMTHDDSLLQISVGV